MGVWRDGKRFLWPLALAVPLLPFVAYGVVRSSGIEAWWWLGPLQNDRFYRWTTFLDIPLAYGGLVLGAWQWTTADLGWVGRIGMVLTIGIVSGIAINTAHELGHELASLERRLSKITLAPSAYVHFYVEHNRGHHSRVATPADPASARVGENFYRFWLRTVSGSLGSAVSLEWKRFRGRGQSPWTWRNDVLSAWALTVALWGGPTLVFGWVALPFLIAQAVVGFTLLESVNYLEHDGLKRGLNAVGRYEKVDARHSWNSNRLATNVFLYHPPKAERLIARYTR